MDNTPDLEQNDRLDMLCMDPNEIWFFEQRDKLCDRLNKRAQDLRREIRNELYYDTLQEREELAAELDDDRLNLLALLLSHDTTGPTGWVVNLECCGPFRIDIIFNQLNALQEFLKREDSNSAMVDSHLRLIATQIGRLRIETFIVDERADRMDEEAITIGEHISGFQQSDLVFKSWKIMEAPFESCLCSRCKKWEWGLVELMELMKREASNGAKIEVENRGATIQFWRVLISLDAMDGMGI